VSKASREYFELLYAEFSH